jgi:hypothetical protein
MFRFLEAYYTRGGKKGDLVSLLSDIQSISPDGRPADPAAWDDWMIAVKKSLDDRERSGG